MGESTYDVASGLEVPGLEAIMEYGDASTFKNGRVPDAYRMNDKSLLERLWIEQISGLHDDPDGRDARQLNSDRHGETAGQLLYGGRTIGLSGEVVAGGVRSVREVWRRSRRALGIGERDLVIYPIGVGGFYVNEIPTDMTDAASWGSSVDGTGTLGSPSHQTSGSLSVAQITLSSATAATGDFNINNPASYMTPWSGEDVFVGALVAQTAGAVATSIEVDLIAALGSDSASILSATIINAASISSPTASVFNWIGGRIAASSMPPGTTYVGIQIKINRPATSGTYTMQAARPMLSLLDQADVTPSYVGSELAGFESDGLVGKARSYGPCYATNMISDPTFASNVGQEGGLWGPSVSSGVTVNYCTSMPVGVSGSQSDRSLVFKTTKDSNTTSRSMSLINTATLDPSGLAPVAFGRNYRLSCLIDVASMPTDAPTYIRVIWYAPDATTTFGVTAATLALGVNQVSLSLTPPAGAVLAALQLITTTAQSAVVLQFSLSDPCLSDITEVDVGAFVGVGEPTEEIQTQASVSGGVQVTGARKRIPRPFLVRRVRKTSDAKAPEQQSDAKIQRAFTMSLRASDPRVYVLDWRRASTALSSPSHLAVSTMVTDFTLDSATLPTPTGWTSEGSFTTNPGGSPFVWTNQAYNYAIYGAAPVLHPNGGRGQKIWNALGAYGSNQPTSNLIERYYRSAESYTYTNPKVILGCAPQGFGWPGPTSTDTAQMMFFRDGSTPPLYYWNYVAILLKRISSTSWLELRWNNVSKAAAAAGGADVTNCPFAFEVWSSHNQSGTLSTTRLAGWDYASYNSTSNIFPFVPSRDPMWLVALLDSSDVIHWELWRSYPTPSNLVAGQRLESGLISLNSGLAGVLGSGHAGSSGFALFSPKGPSQLVFQSLASVPPFVHHFESSDSTVTPATATISVIGDIDTPQKIVLRGDMINPILTISVPEMDGFPAKTTVARFTGTILDVNPITIDLSGPSFTAVDSLGNDAFSYIVPGSNFAALRPGLNQVSLQALAYGSFSEHISISHRDALK